MGSFAIIAIIGGLLILGGLYWWTRLRQELATMGDVEDILQDVPLANSQSGVLVTSEHGQLIHINAKAREWFGLSSGNPDLEFLANFVQPLDNFLQLFVGEGQASFQLGNRWLEASSHAIPVESGRRMVVVMRELRGASNDADTLDLSLAMTIVNQIGAVVNASMGIEQVAQLLLDIVREAVGAEAGEICLLERDGRTLRQRGWVGDTRYLLMMAEKGGHYRMGDGIVGWVAQHRTPALVRNKLDPMSVRRDVDHNPFESIITIPLVLGERLLGTLGLFSNQTNAFNQNHLALLQAISNSLTIAIHNVELYVEQGRRISDIASLQEIAEEEQDQANIYRLLTKRIAELVDADMCGIFLFDADRNGLVAQLPFYGLPDHVAQMIFISLPVETPQYEIWANQPYWLSNDLEDEPMAGALGLAPVVEVAGIRNTALIPMQIGGERIGVIAVSNKRSEGGFTPRDVQNLRVLATQAAIVVENIRLYEREQRIGNELIGLQEMTHAIGALSHEDEFYAEINERIAHLMGSQMCGILLYDPSRAALVAQLPFYGLPDHDIINYSISLEPNSVMEELWLEEVYWYSNRVTAEAIVFAAELDGLAERLGVQKTLIAKLSAGGRRIGVVQVSNKLDGSDYTDSDARLLQIFATQAAAIIENARLYREVQRNAEQAESLRRVAELAGSIFTNEQSFTPVLQEIGRIMNTTQVFISVLDHTTGNLVTYSRWTWGFDLPETVRQDATTPDFHYSVAVSGRTFLSNDIRNDKRVLAGYSAIAARFNINQAILVPLAAGERNLGELGVGNRPSNRPYTEEDAALLRAIAAQITAAVERLLLFEATGENLRRRVLELDAISRISNELTLTVNLDKVLDVIRHEAAQATKADGSTIALLLPQDMWSVADKPELDRRIGYAEAMRTLADIELEAVSRGADPVLVDDYERSPYRPEPTKARSALAVAILYLDQIVGVLHLYHHNPNHFDDRAATFLMTLSTKASSAYQNDIRYREQIERGERLRRRVDQLNRIFELGQMLHTTTDPVTVLEAVAYSVQQSVGYDTVLMLVVDEAAGLLRRAAQAGMPLDQFESTRDRVLSLERLDEILKADYEQSDSYFFPVEEAVKWVMDGVEVLSPAFNGNRTMPAFGKKYWHDGDMLIVKIRAAGGQLIGLMSVDRPHDNLRPDRANIEMLEIFAHQASAMLENMRLLESSVRNAEQESHLNEVMEAISSTLDLSSIAESIARGTQQLFTFSRMTLAVLDAQESGYDVIRVQTQDDGQLHIAQDHRSSLERTALGVVFAEKEERLYDTADAQAQHYEDIRSWAAHGERHSLLLPLIAGGESIGVLHFGIREPAPDALLDARAILRRMAQLIASSIQNSRLFNQAVTLQVLNYSVVESIQQGIVVLNNSGRIVTVNEFMRQRYGWTQEALQQDLFTYRPEMAEYLKDDVRYVLETGEPRDRLNQMTREGDIDFVRNFYIYPLRYNDMVRGAVLLVEDVTERAALEQAMETRANQLAALTEVSMRISSSLERDEVIALALEEMGWIIPYDTMTIWRRNGSYMVLEGMTGEKLVTEVGYRIRFKDYERMRTVAEDQRVSIFNFPQGISDPLVPGEQEMKSWIGIPLINQGHVVGMMVLTKREVGFYDRRAEQHIGLTFANQVAIALANADLFEQTFDRTNELGTLLEAAQATSQNMELDKVFHTVVELMFNALEMDNCIIMILDDVDNALEVQVDLNRSGVLPSAYPPGLRLDLGKHPAKQAALRQREAVVIADSGDAQRGPYPEELEDLREHGYGARILVPLIVNEQSIGLIQLDQLSNDEQTLTQQKVRLARALGSQVAIAIQNARLRAETNTRFEEMLTINALTQAISSTLNLNDMLKVVRDQVPMVTKADEMYLALYDAATQQITFPLAVKQGKEIHIPPRQLGNDEVSYIIKRRRSLNLGADYFSIDELRKSMGIVNGEGDAKSYMGVPLVAGDEVVGVLAVRDANRTRAFNVNNENILTTVGAQLGAAIQNARLYQQVTNFAADLNRLVEERTEELERERDRLDTLYQITSELARTLDMDSLLERALGMVSKAVGAGDAVILLSDPITDNLYSRAVLNPNSLYWSEDDERQAHPAEELANWLIQSDSVEPVIVVDDLQATDYWDPDMPGASHWRSAMAVLLEMNEDPVGVMVLLSEQPNAFSETQLKLLVPAANQVAAAINSADLYQLIRDQAERLGTLLRTEQEEAERSSAILESIADGVLLADASGVITLFNSAAERILQIPRDQILGEPITKLTGLYGQSGSVWLRVMQEWSTHPPEDKVAEVLDERLELGDRIVSLNLSPVFIGEVFLGTVSVFRDITTAVEVDRMKSDFITRVSHEFRTPLTPIKGFTDLLLMGAAGTLTEKQVEMMSKIKSNVERLSVLVNDVLDISKLDANLVEMKMQYVNLGEIIPSVVERIASRSHNVTKGIQHSVHIASDVPPIRADRDKLIQIINNVVDNAYNYNRKKGRVDVTVRHQPHNHTVLIAVSDSGVGIPDEFKDAVWRRFERFEQHALELDVPGTGLGLPLVKELVARHNGHIWFESKLNEGTTFFIELPVEQPNYITSTTELPAVNPEVVGD